MSTATARWPPASRRIEEASMITANALTRVAGTAAVAAGVVFIGVPIGDRS